MRAEIPVWLALLLFILVGAMAATVPIKLMSRDVKSGTILIGEWYHCAPEQK